MRWYVIRNPDSAGLAVVAESSLPHHKARGWMRVSDGRIDETSFDVDEYAEAPDLDAAPAVEVSDPAGATSDTAAGDRPAKPSTSKEKA